MDTAPTYEYGATVPWTDSILHKLFAVTEGHPQQHSKWNRRWALSLLPTQQVHGTDTEQADFREQCIF